MTKPTDTSESLNKFGIFREDASDFTEDECLQGQTYEDAVEAGIALDELKKVLPVLEHKRLSVREIKSLVHENDA